MSSHRTAKPEDRIFKLIEESNYQDCIKLLDRESLDVNVRDDKRYATPLMLACAASNFALVDILLAKNAKIELQDDAGWTALTWACWGCGCGRGWVHEGDNSFNVINQLIIHSQKVQKDIVSIKTHAGFTPLMMFVKYFMQKIAPPKESDQVKNRSTASILKKQIDVINLLIPTEETKKKLVYSKNNFGETVFQIAPHKYRDRINETIKSIVPPSDQIPELDDGPGDIVDEQSRTRTQDSEDTKEEKSKSSSSTTTLLSCIGFGRSEQPEFKRIQRVQKVVGDKNAQKNKNKNNNNSTNNNTSKSNNNQKFGFGW